MFRAAGIELAETARAGGVAGEIFANGQLQSAGAAEDRAALKFISRPNHGSVTGKFEVASVTWKPIATAFEPDRDDVALAVIVRATCFMIDFHANDADAMDFSRGTIHTFLVASRGQSSTRMEAMIQQAIMSRNPPLKEPLR